MMAKLLFLFALHKKDFIVIRWKVFQCFRQNKSIYKSINCQNKVKSIAGKNIWNKFPFLTTSLSFHQRNSQIQTSKERENFFVWSHSFSSKLIEVLRSQISEIKKKKKTGNYLPNFPDKNFLIRFLFEISFKLNANFLPTKCTWN